MQIYYRPTTTKDREERIEDDTQRDALIEVFGGRLTLLDPGDAFPDEGLHLGRRKNTEVTAAQYLPYWHDPGFLVGISRFFEIADFETAEAHVEALHRSDLDAFVKAQDLKLMTKKVPRGQSLLQAIGDMAYSFIDRPEALMVQEFVEMKWEHRFVVIGGKIVTHSPALSSLTPQARTQGIELTGGRRIFGDDVGDLHFATPSLAEECVHDPDLTRRMIDHVEHVIAWSAFADMIVDVCELHDGRIETIEFNPMIPGGFGLYACDPLAIARACQDLTQRAENFRVSGPIQEADVSFFDLPFLDG